MKKLLQNNDIILQNYGAAELKAYSENATYKAFGITLFIFGLIFLLFYLVKTETKVNTNAGVYCPEPVVLVNYTTKPQVIKKIFELPVPKEIFTAATGTQEISGHFVASSNLTVENQPHIASVENMGISSATQGTAKSINEIPQTTIDNGNGNENAQSQSNLTTTVLEEIPFTYVDKEPETDLVKLQKNIIYPELARKARIEGKVLIRVLIGTNGNVLKAKIDMSDNEILDDAALKAVMTPGIFKPAILGNNNVECWISIPIQFRLR